MKRLLLPIDFDDKWYNIIEMGLMMVFWLILWFGTLGIIANHWS